MNEERMKSIENMVHDIQLKLQKILWELEEEKKEKLYGMK